MTGDSIQQTVGAQRFSAARPFACGPCACKDRRAARAGKAHSPGVGGAHHAAQAAGAV